MVFPAFFRRNSVGKSFNIGDIWLVTIHVDGLLEAGVAVGAALRAAVAAAGVVAGASVERAAVGAA